MRVISQINDDNPDTWLANAIRWLGWIVLAGIIAIPVLIYILDTTPAYATAVFAFLLLLAILIKRGIRREHGETVLEATILFIPFICMFIPFFVFQNTGWFGPCHLFGQLRASGCIRSIPVANHTPFLFMTDQQTGQEQIIRATNQSIHIEGISRWQLPWRTTTVHLEDHISWLNMWPDGSQLHAYDMIRLSPVTLDSFNRLDLTFPMATIAHTLIDLPSGELLDRVTLDLSDPTAFSRYTDDWEAYNQRPVTEEAPVHRWISGDFTWEAINFHNGNIMIWRIDTIVEPLTALKPLEDYSLEVELPAEAPHWTLTPDKRYRCLAWAKDGRFLAGQTTGSIDIYDVAAKTLLTSITAAGIHHCPTFSSTGQFIAFSERHQPGGLMTFSLADAQSGTILATVPTGHLYTINNIDFSADDSYIALTGDYSRSYSRAYRGIIIDLPEFLSQAAK